MSRSAIGAAARPLRRIFGAGTVAGLAEWELLRRYLERGDEDAFAAIVARHGPMVLGACRRVLADPADADDAFQVTFLTLARKGRSLGESDAIGPWLYGVALRVALRARTASSRRRNHEGRAQARVAGASDLEGPDRRELGAIVAEELAGLPAKYRAPLVLCQIEDLTHEDAARQLGWPVGTVKGRLSRARDLLRGRLARRGLEPAHAPALMALVRGELPRVPADLAARTVRAALDFAAGRAAGGAPATAAALLRELGEEAMFAKFGKVAVAAMVALGTGAGVLAYQETKGPKDATPASAPADPARPGVVSGRMDGAEKRVETVEAKLEEVPRAGPFAQKNTISPRPPVAQGSRDPLARIRAMAAQPGPPGPKDAAIRAKLNEVINMNLPADTTLANLLKYVAESTQEEAAGLAKGIPIYVDPQGLQDADKTMESTVSIRLDGIPLRVSLALALKQIGLRFRVEDGLLIVGSPGDSGVDAPIALMLAKAERGDLTREEYMELIEILKLRKVVVEQQSLGGGFR